MKPTQRQAVIRGAHEAAGAECEPALAVDFEFAEALANCRQRVYGFIFRRILNRELAEDLAGEVVTLAWERRQTFHPSKSLLHWQFGIARNVINTHFRRETAHKRSSSIEMNGDSRRHAAAMAAPERRVDQGLTPPEEAYRSERIALVRRAVNGLAAGDRQVIDLYYYRQMTTAETAAAVGRSPSAVESALNRIRARLRATLTPVLENPEPCGPGKRNRLAACWNRGKLTSGDTLSA